MILDTRRLIPVGSGQFKVAAAARLAEGGTAAPFEAGVLLHAAARAERRALDATEAPTPQDRLRSAVEVCGCLIDALDRSVVLDWAWGRVLEASEVLPEAEARAIRARLDAKFGPSLRSYQRVLKHTPKVVMFRALTGELPFDTTPTTELLTHQLFSAAPPPSWLVDDLDPSLETIVLTAMRKHPDSRYATMTDLVADLDRLLRNDAVLGAPLVHAPDECVPQTDSGRKVLHVLGRSTGLDTAVTSARVNARAPGAGRGEGRTAQLPAQARSRGAHSHTG